MQLLSITEFIGRFHPVLVHLPIGILIFAIILLWLSRKAQYRDQQKALYWALVLGCASAILSCLSGWFLSSSGEYEESTLGLHQWMGITTAFISLLVLFYFNKERIQSQKPRNSLLVSVLLLVCIIITGHLGGTLTHGEGYLTTGWQVGSDSASKFIRKSIPNVAEAQVYADVISPIFQEKCFSCHGDKKQKGGLRLSTPEGIVKGGKDGPVLDSTDYDKSELLKRITMDPLEDHHMPPKGKPQLSEKDILLIHWWLQNGATFKKKVKDLEQPANIKPVLIALQSPVRESKQNTGIPDKPVAAADPRMLTNLAKKGIVILPVTKESHYLAASFAYTKSLSTADWNMLDSISSQLIWLKMNNPAITNKNVARVANYAQLTRLSLDHAAINDSAIASLQKLKNLEWLSLVGTPMTAKGLAQLDSLKHLTHLYCYHTRVNTIDWFELKKALPRVLIDTGNYNLPLLPGDTSILKMKDLKKNKN